MSTKLTAPPGYALCPEELLECFRDTFRSYCCENCGQGKDVCDLQLDERELQEGICEVFSCLWYLDALIASVGHISSDEGLAAHNI